MSNSDKDLIITPNRGSSSADPKIVFSGASSTLGPQNITLQVYPTNSGTLSFEGSAGQLFSITNSLSGTIFSVNDVSGIPSIEVIDTGLVKLAQYGGNVLIGTGTDEGAKLVVNGGVAMTSGWNRTLTVKATYPGIVFNSADTRWATLSYDHSSSFIIRVGATSADTFGSGATAITINQSGIVNFNSAPTQGGSSTFGINISGNAATATTFSTDRTNYSGITNGAVAGQMMWKNYGNNHTIFDASAGTSPTGVSVDRTTPAQPVTNGEGENSWGWSPNLMGWNGTATYGLKVDFARRSLIHISDTAPTALGAGQLWWESDTGKLKIRYNDGTSSQWVDAVPIPDLTTYYSKAGGTITGPVVVNSSITTTGYVFAPRFVDVDSPGYYVDPGAATSALFAGNLGIGITAPSSRLHIRGTGDTFVYSDSPTGAYKSGINLANAGNTYGQLYFDNSNNNVVLFQQYASGSLLLGTNNAEKMRITSDGNVGIGTTAPATKLDVNGTATATAFNSTSDRDLKENFEPIVSPLEKISQLTGYIYNFKSDEDKRRHAGVVAQDVVKVLPEAVSDSGSRGLSVSYNDIVALLIEAVKAQNQTIETLKNTVQDLAHRHGI